MLFDFDYVGKFSVTTPEESVEELVDFTSDSFFKLLCSRVENHKSAWVEVLWMNANTLKKLVELTNSSALFRARFDMSGSEICFNSIKIKEHAFLPDDCIAELYSDGRVRVHSLVWSATG